MPAVRIAREMRTLWPNQPTRATHWSIDDIRRAHETLAEAERSGRTMDPNDALHDFPLLDTNPFPVHPATFPRTPGATRPSSTWGTRSSSSSWAATAKSGPVAGSRTPPRWWRTGDRYRANCVGTSIVGGERFEVGPGDWVSIPANTPTQVTTRAGGGLTYMVMKINAMLYPWEFIR